MKEEILLLLKDPTLANRIHWYNSIESTNTEAKRLAKEGAPQGTFLIADHQTGGRGRLGRNFSSPAGMGIYLSVILRPGCAATELMHLTCAAAVAMCDAVETVSGLRPGVKWINDLIVNGKKLGGILTELALVPGTNTVDYAIVGIGINCHQQKMDFPEDLQPIATSIFESTGITIERCRLAAEMINALTEMSHHLLVGKENIMARYAENCITLGQDIYLLQGDKKTPCKALSLDADGGLIVAFSDGSVQTVSSGEVSVRSQ